MSIDLTKLCRKMVMLDLETLATSPKSVVYEVGLVVFDCNVLPNVNVEIRETYLWRLHTRDQGKREINPDTLEWMKKTEGRADAYLTALADGVSMRDFLSGFVDLAIWNQHPLVWAQGTDFDFPILEDMLRGDGYAVVPWAYRHKRDLRTLTSIAKALGWKDKSETKVEHSALVDAHAQAHRAGSILSFLQLNGTTKLERVLQEDTKQE